MRIFITGATGYIGSALVRAFAKAGHEVGGLVRTREKEAQVAALGGVPIFGHLEDPELYQHFAAESDVVISAAAPSPSRDPQVVETLISAMKAEAEDKAFILTSGCLVLGATGDTPVDESGSTDRPFEPVAWRPQVERYTLQQASGPFRTAVIRPGWVYGGAQGGVLARYVKSAARGAAEYVGEGRNKMAYVHIDDVADFYVRVVEKKAGGIFHLVDESNLTTAELAKRVADAAGQGGKTRSVPLEAARNEQGAFAAAFVLHQRLAATRARELGWTPRHRDIADAVDEAVKNLKAARAS